jgi:hypothetical protein
MGGKTPSTHAANVLATLSQQMFAESDPARRLMLRQLREALATGGIGARIPIIQQAVRNVQATTQQQLQQARNLLARQGLGASPFAATLLSGIQAAGAQQAATIPTDIARELISAGPNLLSGATGIPGLAPAAAIQERAQAQGTANQQATLGTIGQIGTSLGQLGGTLLAERLAARPAEPPTTAVPAGTGGTTGGFSLLTSDTQNPGFFNFGGG